VGQSGDFVKNAVMQKASGGSEWAGQPRLYCCDLSEIEIENVWDLDPDFDFD
jgi:hypothetical protein